MQIFFYNFDETMICLVCAVFDDSVLLSAQRLAWFLYESKSILPLQYAEFLSAWEPNSRP